MKTIDEIREAFLKLGCVERSGASQDREQIAAALTVMGAVDELAGLRAGKAVLDKFATTGSPDLGRAALVAIQGFYEAAAKEIAAQPEPKAAP